MLADFTRFTSLTYSWALPYVSYASMTIGKCMGRGGWHQQPTPRNPIPSYSKTESVKIQSLFVSNYNFLYFTVQGILSVFGVFQNNFSWYSGVCHKTINKQFICLETWMFDLESFHPYAMKACSCWCIYF